jgi:hypothetical protein
MSTYGIYWTKESKLRRTWYIYAGISVSVSDTVVTGTGRPPDIVDVIRPKPGENELVRTTERRRQPLTLLCSVCLLARTVVPGTGSLLVCVYGRYLLVTYSVVLVAMRCDASSQFPPPPSIHIYLLHKGNLLEQSCSSVFLLETRKKWLLASGGEILCPSCLWMMQGKTGLKS